MGEYEATKMNMYSDKTKAIKDNKKDKRYSITFVRAGEKVQPRSTSSGGLLATLRDWQLQVDLRRQLKFPEHITATPLHPDIVLISVNKASGPAGTHCPLERPAGRSHQAEKGKIRRAGRLPEQRLENPLGNSRG